MHGLWKFFGNRMEIWNGEKMHHCLRGHGWSLESILFLGHVLSLVGSHLLLLVPPFGILYPLMSAIPSLTIFHSKLKPTYRFNDFPASICTSELCKEGYMKLKLYCIVLKWCWGRVRVQSAFAIALFLLVHRFRDNLIGLRIKIEIFNIWKSSIILYQSYTW